MRILWISDLRWMIYDLYVIVYKVFKLYRGFFVIFYVYRQLVVEYVECYFVRWEYVFGIDWDLYGLGLME